MFGVSRRISNGFRGWQQIVKYSDKSRCDRPQMAVVLSGCGRLDGSEIHESVSILSHITRNEALPYVFAPCMKQKEVINHLTEEEDKASNRNVLAESARLIRGSIKPVADLAENFKDFHAVIFAGGRGVVKNLSDYVDKGVLCKVDPDVVKVLESCHKAKIPLGFVGWSAFLPAKVLCKVTVTAGQSCPAELWPHKLLIEDIQKLGAVHEVKTVDEVSHDKKNNVYSTPGFLYQGQYHEIDDGIGKLIKAMIVYMQHGKPC